MINEQIKSWFDELLQVLKKILAKLTDGTTVLLRPSTPAGQFVVLNFMGVADGSTPLTLFNDIRSIRGKVLTIKRIKFDFYPVEETVQAFQSTTFPAYTPGTYLICAQDMLLLPQFIGFAVGVQPRLTINGEAIAFIGTNANGYTHDFDLDNLFLKYAPKLQDIQWVVFSSIPVDYTANPIVFQNPTIKVLMECYLDYKF